MKHIKKSMFISTVLMVVMLIAALSTATFAWYTSNNTVASTAIVASAAKSDSANIGIGWYKGAPTATITFHPLQHDKNQAVTNYTTELTAEPDLEGHLYPVAPVTYYNKYGDTAASNPTDKYLTSTESDPTKAGTFVDNGFAEGVGKGYDYKRVVNLTTTDITTTKVNPTSQTEAAGLVKAKADYIHNPGSGKATNWSSAQVDAIAANYDVVYTTTKYAYNNTIAVGATGAPTNSNFVSVTDNVYTVQTTDLANKVVYKVAAVYQVAADGSDSLTAAAQNNNKISPLYAYDLINAGAGASPQTGYYVVAYTVYMHAPYTDYANYATHEGYLGDAAATLNTGDISISDLSNATYNLTHTPKYDDNGFAYLYMIYKHSETYAPLTVAKDTFDSFAFTQANVDTTGYFKGVGSAATIGAFWSGNEGSSLAYTGSGKQFAVITGTTSASSKATMSSFYVTNNGTTATTSPLNVSLTATGNNAANLRVAVFTRVGDGNNFTYYGTLANASAPTTFGTILKGGNALDMPKYTASTTINLGTLGAGSVNALEIQLVAWFDGTGLDDTLAAQDCTFSLNFSL